MKKRLAMLVLVCAAACNRNAQQAPSAAAPAQPGAPAPQASGAAQPAAVSSLPRSEPQPILEHIK
ncbi:MAG: hypothetical protein DMF86_02890, partial [Acidobacteria bacterium]